MEKLAAMRPAHLVMGGVATNHVVETSARYAIDSGYNVIVLEDLCASFNEELHDFSFRKILPRYVTVMSSDEYLTAGGNPMIDGPSKLKCASGCPAGALTAAVQPPPSPDAVDAP